MLVFAADNHYGTHPGKNGYEMIADSYPGMVFAEDDWSVFTQVDLARDCELLILNMIAGTCDVPLPDEAAAAAVRRYCETGKPLLLLHGASSAFWHHDWWRINSGLRWVRPNDPDQIPPSTHPVEPFTVSIAKVRHELAAKLVPMDLPKDEIYTELEQTQPMWVLMSTEVNGKSYPQCVESANRWGGRVINFLPGHQTVVTRHPDYVANLKTLINDLLGK